MVKNRTANLLAAIGFVLAATSATLPSAPRITAIKTTKTARSALTFSDLFPAYHYERTFRANWSNEAKAFFAAFELPHQVTSGFQYEVNEIEVIFGGARAPDCAPDPTWGFCRDLPSPAYRIYQVSPERALDAGTIRRGLFLPWPQSTARIDEPDKTLRRAEHVRDPDDQDDPAAEAAEPVAGERSVRSHEGNTSVCTSRRERG